jgi:hypothetical protein
LPTTANGIAILASARVANAVVVGSAKGTFHGHHYTPVMATVNYSRSIRTRKIFRKICLLAAVECNVNKDVSFDRIYWQAGKAHNEVLSESITLLT